jgi:hypothetical protein
MADGVAEWLTSLKLDQYATNFAEQGYDTSDAIADLDEADLDAIGVTLPGHKKRLLMAAKRYSPDDPVVKPKVVKALPSYENWGGDVAGSFAVAEPEPRAATPPPEPEPEPEPLPPVPTKPAAPAPDYEPEPAPPSDVVLRPKKGPPPVAPKRATSLFVEAPVVPPAKPSPTPAKRAPSVIGAPKPPTLPTRTESSVQPREYGKKQVSAAASTAPTEGSDEVLVEHEAMGVLRSLDVDQTTTAIQALELFAAKYKTGTASEDGSKAWRMFEAFAVPNVERCLPDSENLVRLIKRWPKVDGVYVPGCRFVIKAVTSELFSNGNAAHAGVLEKRGGSKGGKGKSWKSRYFRIEEEGLVYYKTEPTSKKQLKSPLGTWPLAGWTLFSVRESVRKGKAGQYICLREETEPLWSADAATAMDQFEACKFMCAEDEQDEMKWISSVQAAQNVTTDSVEDVRRERLASVAALPATAAESAADDEQVASSDEEVVDSADTAALRMRKVDPHEATQLAKRISTVPEDYKPIVAKKVMGVGFGNIFAAVPTKSTTADAADAPGDAPRAPALLPPGASAPAVDGDRPAVPSRDA